MLGLQDPDWIADVARIGPRWSFVREHSLWAIWVYRYGRRIDRLKEGLYKRIATKWYWALFRLVETITGISLPKSCDIGPGLRIWHFGGIFIHPNAIIGKSCTLRQGVTIGNRGNDDRAPILGDFVELGAYATAIANSDIAEDLCVGALTSVVKSLPAGWVAVGAAVRMLPPRTGDGDGND